MCRKNTISRVGVSEGLVVRASWNDATFSPSSVVDRKEIAKGMHRVLIDVGPKTSEAYTKAGQFVQAKIDGSKPGFFAIASAPDQNNAGVIELLIKNQGETAELICQTEQGSSVEVSDVMGKGFPIEKIPASEFPVVYIFATGSGISPIKALVESGALNAKERKAVVLYYGARNAESMAYGDQIKNWKEGYGVEVVPVYSDDKKGYVQDVFVKDGRTVGAGVAAVLCGQKEMAEAITENLTTNGVEKEYILTNF